MTWVVLLSAVGLLAVGLWFLVSLIWMLRDYDDVDWGDDDEI